MAFAEINNCKFDVEVLYRCIVSKLVLLGSVPVLTSLFELLLPLFFSCCIDDHVYFYVLGSGWICRFH